MFKSDNSQQLLIGKSLNRTASVNVVDVNHASYLADGEVVVLDENDAVMAPGTTFASSKYIKVVQRSGATALTSQLIQSDRIDGANVIAYSGSGFTASQEQIHSIGFNGTSGSIDSAGTEDYVLRLTFKQDKTIWSHYSNTRIWRYEPDTTNTQKEVADYFAQQISSDAFSKSEVLVERLINAASTGSASANWTFTKGSKTVTTNAAETTAVVGDYVRDVSGAGATSDAAYRIVTISGTTITLDQEFQGTSATINTPGYLVAATAATAAFGIVFTGVAQTFTVGKFKYQKVAFELQLQNFLTSTLTKTQESSRGTGEGEEVAELEWFSNGFEGAIDRVGDSAPAVKADASTASDYDTVIIEYFVNFDSFPVSGAKPARKLLILAIVDGAGQESQILGALNPWMASTPRAFANVSL